MRKKFRIRYMMRAEAVRFLMQPWFWMAAVGVFAIKFINIYGSTEIYQTVFEKNNRSQDFLNFIMMYIEGKFLWFALFSLCAFPVTENYIQDKKNNRMSLILPRSGCLCYAVVQVLTTLFGAFCCMLFGDLLLIAVGHWGLGHPFAQMPCFNEVVLLQNNQLVFWIFYEIQGCLYASFFALLTLMVSFWIQNKQFITILPIIFSYFFTYFLTSTNPDMSWLPMWICPKEVYMYNWGRIFYGDVVKQCLYAGFYTVVVALVIITLLYRILKRQVKG